MTMTTTMMAGDFCRLERQERWTSMHDTGFRVSARVCASESIVQISTVAGIADASGTYAQDFQRDPRSSGAGHSFVLVFPLSSVLWASSLLHAIAKNRRSRRTSQQRLNMERAKSMWVYRRWPNRTELRRFTSNCRGKKEDKLVSGNFKRRQ